MPADFEHRTLPQRVVFRAGGSRQAVADEVARRGAQRILVVSSARGRAVAEQVCAGIEPTAWFTDVEQHVPVEAADRARGAARQAEADLVVSIGGGSATGFAKAIALTSGIPIVAVPTTYAGSEATNVWGLTDGDTKSTGVDDRVLPQTVIYDAALTTGLPIHLSVASGLNGLAHCIDSLWAPGADPINTVLALEGAGAIVHGLRTIVTNPEDLEAREATLYGCYLAAVAFASAGAGLHHKICHVLGGTFGLPHAQTHAVVLPHVLALNAPAVPEIALRLAAALGGTAGGGEGPVALLDRLYSELDAPRSLVDLGFTLDDVPEAARRCRMAAPPSNPASVDEGVLIDLLRAATIA